jgi:hypothetical protein
MRPRKRHLPWLAGLLVLGVTAAGCGSSGEPDQAALQQARQQGAAAAHRADEIDELRREVKALRRDRADGGGHEATPSPLPPPSEEPGNSADSRIPVSGTYYGRALQRGTPADVNKDYPLAMTFSSAGSRVSYPSLGCEGTLLPAGFEGDARVYRETIESGHCDSGGTWKVRVDGTTLAASWSLESASYVVDAVLELGD